MATIRKLIDIDIPVEAAWDVVRDVNAVHTRFAPGFVVNTVPEPGARLVTFANGRTVRERIVSVDATLQRVAYSVVGTGLDHHHASFEVIALAANRTRIVWTADVLPDTAAATIAPMMDAGSAAIARALSRKDA